MRRHLRLILCLVLGLATTILAAALLAAFRPVPMYPRQTIGVFERWNRPWHIAEVHPIGVHDIWWLDLNADTPGPTEDLIRKSREELDERPVLLPPTFRHSAPTWGTFQGDAPESLIGSDTAFGFPFPCLWYQVIGETSAGSSTVDHEVLKGGLLLKGDPSARIRSFSAIPLRPLWRPLAIDAAAFALLWWIVLSTPGGIRRALRRRKGLCIACGYDLNHNAAAVCPECGSPREAPAVTHA